MATPSETTVFSCFSTDLIELLGDIHKGKIQLPDFQRDWVWDDNRICNLVASVSLKYPIGAIMLLEVNTDEIDLKKKTIDGVPKNNNNPTHLILDGQQRLTALYISLFSEYAIPVKMIRGSKKEKRFFYLDIEKCLDLTADRDDAVISVPEDRKRKGVKKNFTPYIDVSSKEKEYKEKIFPLNIITRKNEVDIWLDECRDYYKDKKEYENNKNELNLFRHIINGVNSYQVPIIKLKEKTPKEAICQVFVSVNKGGMELKTFELLTAKYAVYTYKGKSVNLRDDWEKVKTQLNIDANSTHILNGVDENSFIQAITLLSNHRKNLEKNLNKAPSCKNKDILNLSFESYNANKKDIVEGFQHVSLLLKEEKISSSTLPYDTQLISLAVIYAAFKRRRHEDFTKACIKQWYWHGVFSEAYAGATETRFANDVFQMHKWIENNEKPDLFQGSIDTGRILRAKTRNSAVYKGVIALLDKEGSQDFMTKYKSYDMEKSVGVDVHHIFPRKYCVEQKHGENKFESVVNKTRIMPETNKIISGKAPSVYLKDIEKKYDKSKENLNKILKTHSIDYALLAKDDFDGFILDRAKRLLKLIENVVGKSVVVSDEEIKKIFDSK